MMVDGSGLVGLQRQGPFVPMQKSTTEKIEIPVLANLLGHVLQSTHVA